MKIKKVGKMKLGLYCRYDMQGVCYLTDDESDVDGILPSTEQMTVILGMVTISDEPGYIASIYDYTKDKHDWSHVGEIHPLFNEKYFYVGEV